ncbi:MAG: D-cysteine desulfhydrase family protein [Fusobacteriaceae bacterium]|jgi:D-cysteine desulfhydrase family pyridoxal phosphate-dependent enzyme|nr:D-cysteine desulfhydrase family protein [Fusobacteriaceae bacterium]
MSQRFRDRLELISYPTRLEELKNLRKVLNAKQRLFIKRDDLTEIGLGGNKNRKLDYVMKEAVDNGADTIITFGAKQSNHCRQTLAYAVHLGLECHLFLTGEDDTPHQGNLFIYDIFGAHLHFVEDENDFPIVSENLTAELIAKGKKPYVIKFAASSPLGALGYIDSIQEISEQAKVVGADIGHLFLASGSGGTQAGAEVGARLFLPNAKIHGVSVSRKYDEQAPKIADLATQTATFIGRNFIFEKSDIIIHDKYFGEKYGIPTVLGIDAIKLLGRTEAILLDPVYTGKAFSALLDLLQKGELDDGRDIAFLHTGGYPAIFNFTEAFYEK